MTKIYFTCAVAGGRDHAFVYQDVVDAIKACGVEVLGEQFADPELESNLGTNPDESPEFIWQRDTDWLKEAQAVVAEVTQPSLGAGYEIGLAESLHKPVLALFYKKTDRRFSPMISGNPNVHCVEYSNQSEVEKAIQDFIAQLV